MTCAAPERLHALDAVRSTALLLGIVLHATMSFFPDPAWIVVDEERSAAMAVTFLVIHIFRMNVFFLIAGFFARSSLHRREVAGFALDRARRIALPLLFSWPILYSSFEILGRWSVHQSRTGPAPASRALGIFDFPLFHTWFLYILLLLYCGALVLRFAVVAIDREGRLLGAVDAGTSFLVRSHLVVAALAIPLAAAFSLGEPWMKALGVPTPDHGLLPNVQSMVAFATAFAFGWMLHRRVDLLETWRRSWPAYLGLAIGLTLLCLVILGEYQRAAERPAQAIRVFAATAYPLAIWTWSISIVGFSVANLSRRSGVRRYVADASYWIYLVHLPIVVGLQIFVSRMELPWFAKFAVIVVGAMAVSLGSYHLFVRFTFLGALLEGKRREDSVGVL